MDSKLIRRDLLRSAAAAAARTAENLRRSFGGGEPGLLHMAAAVTAAVAGVDLAANFWPTVWGRLILCLAVLAAAELGLWLAAALLRRFLGRSLGWLTALVLLTASVAYTVERGAGEGWTWRVWLFTAFAAGTLALLGGAWWCLLVKRRTRPLTAAAALTSAAAAAALAVFWFGAGFPDRVIGSFLALAPKPEASLAALEPSLGPGPHSVAVLDYGPDTDLDAGTVNLTAYMSRDTGDFTGGYVDAYWDYDLNAVPLAGRVWYPEDAENCPVLFIAHGNHEIRTPSYQGYRYLGEYLAGHGYVVVSVDENACNMLSGENDGRAVLLLENIGKLLQFSEEEGNPLYRKMDVDNLAVAGHSRGGEMAATAFLFNGYDCYPENGTVKFDYGYRIKSVIAIAPTVDQYRPADHSVEVEDVNYLLLHGSADRDVTSFMGMEQYENVTFTGKGDYLKTALYIAGANHGQFNSLWGAYDQHGAQTPMLNRRSLLSEEEQQTVAKLFIKVFLDVTLKGDNGCRALLTDWDSCAAQLPETVYYQCWESSGFQPIADFEEDSDLETAAMEGVALSASGFNWWTEELLDFTGKGHGDTHALRLRWNGTAWYHVSTPPLELEGGSLCFDICDLGKKSVGAGDYALVDGAVRVTDGSGNTVETAISDYAVVFPILPVQTDKLDFLFHTRVYKQAMATVSIPGSVFASGGVDSSDIVSIELVFQGNGEVAVDNIGIEIREAGS